MNLKIYLSGSIKKGHQDKRDPVHFWTDEHEALIRRYCGAKK